MTEPLKCDLCEATIENIDTAIDNGWSPDAFSEDGKRQYGPICPQCMKDKIIDGVDERVIKPEFEPLPEYQISIVATITKTINVPIKAANREDAEKIAYFLSNTGEYEDKWDTANENLVETNALNAQGNEIYPDTDFLEGGPDGTGYAWIDGRPS